MNKLTFLLLSSLLALSMAACSGVTKTSSEAPNSTAANPENVDKSTSQTNQNDATSEMRRRQLNSDIRAREQRNQTVGDESVKADSDLKSQVRSKLEANLPASALAIDAKDGVVTVTGSVVNEDQLRKIEPLTREISGVKSVTVKVAVAVATPEPPDPSSEVLTESHTGSDN